MLIRFNRTREVREAYELYDSGEYDRVSELCTGHLRRGGDPELLILRGQSYLDQCEHLEGFYDLMMGDWHSALAYSDVTGIANFYIGTYASGHRDYAAIDHFNSAIRMGFVEGYIGLGCMRLPDAEVNYDKDGTYILPIMREVADLFTLGSESPNLYMKGRALALRSSCYYHLGMMKEYMADSKESRYLWSIYDEAKTDERCTPLSRLVPSEV